MGELNFQADVVLLFAFALIFWVAVDRLVLRRLFARMRRERGFRIRRPSRQVDRHQRLQRGFRY